MKDLKRKRFVVLVAMAIATMFCFWQIDQNKQHTGLKAIATTNSTDTVTVVIQYQNTFTGNYRVKSEAGDEFSVKPSELVLLQN